MRRSEALQGVRVIKFRSVLDGYKSSELNQCEAAELLGISERTFRRWQQRYEEAGEAGLLDRRLGRASGKRVPVDREEEVERLYRYALQRVHGEALSRAPGAPPRFPLGLHVDEGVPAIEGASGARPAARRTPAQAAATAVAWDDASSGRVAP